MFASSSAALSSLLRVSRASRIRPSQFLRPLNSAAFHVSVPRYIVKPYLLADIGEGITECQIIQWFVQPGARVAQFDKICEVQSDKASVEITSRFDGVIKKLYYDTDAVAIVGKPLVDIDIEGETSQEDAEATLTPDAVESSSEPTNSETLKEAQPELPGLHQSPEGKAKPFSTNKHGTRATPAVRHLSKELGIDIVEVNGTGKDGRVLKEDLQRFASGRESQESSQSQLSPRQGALTSDKVIPITGIRAQMFKSMTRSLSIPHFLYTSPIDFTSLTSMRSRIHESSGQKLSPLPFIIKAVSLALQEFPALNAHVDPTSNADKPNLTYKAAHNFAIAIDSPHGLVVPVIHNVQDLSISAISAKVSELAGRARANKLSPIDFTGATFTISNIGSIGGGAVAPVIGTPQVAILGIGRSRAVAIWDDKEDRPARREECVFSWSADHRVVDGAVVARAGERVRALLEEVGSMVLDLR